MSELTKLKLESVEKLYREYLGLPQVSSEEINWHHQTGKNFEIANLGTLEKKKKEAIECDCIPLTQDEQEKAYEAYGKIPRHEWRPCKVVRLNSDTRVLEILFDEVSKIDDKIQLPDLKLSKIKNKYDF